MARRAFRLSALLRLRQTQENQAAGALARANLALTSAQREALQARAASAGHRFTDATSSQWMAGVAARASLQTLLAEAEAEAELAAGEVDRRKQEWARARRTTKSLDHLKTRHEAAATAAQLAAEQKAMDEFGTQNTPGDLT